MSAIFSFVLEVSMQNLLTQSRLWLVVTVLLALTACGEGEDRALNVSANSIVESRAVALLAAMRSGDEERITKQYSSAFFEKRSRQEWLNKMKALMAERGPMTAYRLRRAQADTRFSGKFYILEYETVHTGNKRLHHLITLLLPVSGGDIQLNGHKITPWETDVDDRAKAHPFDDETKP
jgi:hypothetical protein